MRFENICPFTRFVGDLVATTGQNNIAGYDNRIYFCLSGKGVVTVGNTDYQIKQNTFLMWQAGTIYTYYSEKNDPMSLITCNFDFTNTANSFTIPIPPERKTLFKQSDILSENVVFEDNHTFNGTVYVPEAPTIRPLMTMLLSEYNRKLKYYRLKVNSLLQDILLETARFTDNEFTLKNDALVKEIIGYIQNEFKNNPSNAEISKHFGYHPNYINSLVVRHTGISLHSYVINYKLDRAVQLLMSTGLNIGEIAAEIGMDDALYFARLFKKRFGKSPMQFRNSR